MKIFRYGTEVFMKLVFRTAVRIALSQVIERDKGHIALESNCQQISPKGLTRQNEPTANISNGVLNYFHRDSFIHFTNALLKLTSSSIQVLNRIFRVIINRQTPGKSTRFAYSAAAEKRRQTTWSNISGYVEF